MERLNPSTTVVQEVLQFSPKQLNIVIVNIIDIMLVYNIVILTSIFPNGFLFHPFPTPCGPKRTFTGLHVTLRPTQCLDVNSSLGAPAQLCWPSLPIPRRATGDLLSLRSSPWQDFKLRDSCNFTQ